MVRYWLLALSALTLATAAWAASPTARNPIVVENGRAGTADWGITRPAYNHEIEGYADRVSALPGETVHLYVSGRAPTYTLSVYRMGWYGGVGARLVTQAGPYPALVQAVPPPDPETGLVECSWSVGPSLPVGIDWVTGVYLIRLDASDGYQSYIPLVVREAQPRSDVVFQCSVTTWQAYNDWGGESLYSSATGGAGRTHAYKVSYDRPYAQYNLDQSKGVGSGQFFLYEYNMVRWLERQGYDVSYLTNADVHEDAGGLLRHKLFLSVGHDEYWSKEMRDHVEGARDGGVSLGFFSANACYWQIRLEGSPLGADRIQVCYKGDGQSKDPVLGVDNSRLTVRFRDKLVQRPENTLIGLLFEEGNYSLLHHFAPLHLPASVSSGSEAGRSVTFPVPVVGFEYDSREHDAYSAIEPPNLEVVAASPVDFSFNVLPGLSYSTKYVAPSGAIVFAAGTHAWGWGLDAWGGRASFDPFQTLTDRILREMIDHPIAGDVNGDGRVGIDDVMLAMRIYADPRLQTPEAVRRIDLWPVDPAHWHVGDGKITLRDLTVLLRAALGLADARPTLRDERVGIYPAYDILAPGSAVHFDVSVGGIVPGVERPVGPGVDWRIAKGADMAHISEGGILTVLRSAPDGAEIRVAARSRAFSNSEREAVISVQVPRSVRSKRFAGKPGARGFIDGASDRSLFAFPATLAEDEAGNLYVADTGNSAIRMIDPSGKVSTLAGGHTPGIVDGSGASAAFANPFGLLYQGGRLVVSDTTNNALRTVSLDGTVSTWFAFKDALGYADSEYFPGLVDGPPGTARFSHPTGLTADPSGNLYVADTGNHAIRRITPEGQVVTVAGNGTPGLVDGPVGTSELYYPYGVTWTTDGVWIADTGNHAVRLLKPDGRLVTVAGTGAVGWQDGAAGSATFTLPSSLIVRPSGEIWIVDSGNNVIRSYDPGTSLVSTLLGSGVPGDRPGGDRTARLFKPMALFADPRGRTFVTDESTLYQIDSYP